MTDIMLVATTENNTNIMSYDSLLHSFYYFAFYNKIFFFARDFYIVFNVWLLEKKWKKYI